MKLGTKVSARRKDWDPQRLRLANGRAFHGELRASERVWLASFSELRAQSHLAGKSKHTLSLAQTTLELTFTFNVSFANQAACKRTCSSQQSGAFY